MISELDPDAWTSYRVEVTILWLQEKNRCELLIRDARKNCKGMEGPDVSVIGNMEQQQERNQKVAAKLVEYRQRVQTIAGRSLAPREIRVFKKQPFGGFYGPVRLTAKLES